MNTQLLSQLTNHSQYDNAVNERGYLRINASETNSYDKNDVDRVYSALVKRFPNVIFEKSIYYNSAYDIEALTPALNHIYIECKYRKGYNSTDFDDVIAEQGKIWVLKHKPDYDNGAYVMVLNSYKDDTCYGACYKPEIAKIIERNCPRQTLMSDHTRMIKKIVSLPRKFQLF